MLTIGQLASYAGVTVRAVRHYHQLGLLPEPERDRSGYRSYGADDVVLLIRIRTLADAGVPLAKVPELLDATPEEFAEAVREIDARLRTEIARLRRNRREIAQLAAGDSLALPREVIDYLEMLRAHGASEGLIEIERDAWIIIAAQFPDQIGEYMVDKFRQFEDPRQLKLYELLDDPGSLSVDDPRLEEAADLIVQISEEWEGATQPHEMTEDAFVALLDSFAERYLPITDRLQELLRERGWTGWTNLVRTEN